MSYSQSFFLEQLSHITLEVVTFGKLFLLGVAKGKVENSNNATIPFGRDLRLLLEVGQLVWLHLEMQTNNELAGTTCKPLWFVSTLSQNCAKIVNGLWAERSAIQRVIRPVMSKRPSA